MATYYVDPQNGVNSNAGTSEGAPWRNVPGTRTVNNSGFISASWGTITTSNKISAGDIIILKAGSTHSMSTSGSVLIDSNYYNSGTVGSPIIIRVSSTWGSGDFTFNMGGVTGNANLGFIHISARNYIQINGASSSKRILLINATGYGLMTYGTSGTHQQGIQFSFLDVSNISNIGINCSYSDSWTISDCNSHNNGQLGFSAGGLSDQTCISGTYARCIAHSNGPTDDGSGIQHGFGLYGSTSITYQNCTAYGNGRDGFDSGTTTNTTSSGGTFINCSSYSNGEDGYGCNAGPNENGFFTYINCVAWNNPQAGWNIYAGAQASLYHCLSHHNGNQSAFGGNFMINSEFVGGLDALTSATLRNCIGYKPKAYANVYSYNSSGLVTTISTNNCIWVPRSSNSEVFAETPFGTTFTYTNKPSWSGLNDKLGLSFDPTFIATSTTVFASNDYHLTSSASAASGIGLFLNNTPTGVGSDRDTNTRNNPPDIGMYEVGSPVLRLSAPTNFRIV